MLELEELVLSRAEALRTAGLDRERLLVPGAMGKEGLSRPFLEGGHWMVVAQDHPSADDLIKVKLYTAALGSDIRKHKAAEVLMGAEVLTEENRPLLSALLDKRMNWEV